MSRTQLAEKRSLRNRPRVGRPPRELAGEVDTRILDAAHRVFLERGLGGASMDEIAARAGAGKPTIYARFPNKEALFTAVVMRGIETKVALFEKYVPAGATLEERLTNVGSKLLHWALVGDTVELMRLAAAEARRFPDLASRVSKMAKERGAEAVIKVLGEVVQSEAPGAVPAFAPDRLPGTVRCFLDLIMPPMILRALLGEKRKALQDEIGPYVARCVAVFVAGCRSGLFE